MKRRFVLVLLIITLVVSGCRRSEREGIGSFTPDEAAPPQLDVAVSGCSIGDWGWARGTGSVVNPLDETVTYQLVVAFEAGSTRLGESSIWVRSLSPSQTASWEAPTYLGERSDSMTSCRVITINRWTATTEPVRPSTS